MAYNFASAVKYKLVLLDHFFLNYLDVHRRLSENMMMHAARKILFGQINADDIFGLKL